MDWTRIINNLSELVATAALLLIGCVWAKYVVVLPLRAWCEQQSQSRRERIQKRQNEEREKREWDEKEAEANAFLRAQRLQQLRRYGISVCIRKQDGGKVYFETTLIEALIEAGLTVLPVSQKIARELLSGVTDSLPNDTLALVGTSWIAAHIQTDLDNEALVPLMDPELHCDCRLWLNPADGTKCRIVATAYRHAFVSDCDEATLADLIIDDLLLAADRIDRGEPDQG